MNIARGDLRVHALGHELDIGLGISDAGTGIANGARRLWNSVF